MIQAEYEVRASLILAGRRVASTKRKADAAVCVAVLHWLAGGIPRPIVMRVIPAWYSKTERVSDF